MKKIFISVSLLLFFSVAAGAAVTLNYANFPYGTLSAQITTLSTTLQITAGVNAGAWPTAGNFKAVIFSSLCSAPSSCASREILTLSWSSGSTYTIISRGDENTAEPSSWPAGSKIQHTITGGTLDELKTSIIPVPISGANGGCGQVLPSCNVGQHLTSNGLICSCTNDTGGGGGSTSFDAIGSGTNVLSTMTCGTGCAVTSSGSGVVNANQYKGSSTVTSTEFGYLSGATSALQTQLNSKLSGNQTITLSGDVSGSGTTSIATAVVSASTSQPGKVQLIDSTSSTSTITAATPNSVKTAYDLANGKLSPSGSGASLTGITASQVGALPAAGGTLTGKVTTVTSGSSAASLNIPPGSAPASPNDGDLWSTTAGFYVRANGSTVGPLGTGGAGGSYLPLDGSAGMTGRILASASTTARASINIPQGAAPTSPGDGDCWTTSSGFFCRISGSTIGPFGTGSGGMVYPNAGIPVSAGSSWNGGSITGTNCFAGFNSGGTAVCVSAWDQNFSSNKLQIPNGASWLPDNLAASFGVDTTTMQQKLSNGSSTYSYLPVIATGSSPNNYCTTSGGTLSCNSAGGSGLSTTLTSTHIYVGNSSNIATDMAMSGDVTITNGGVTTVGKILNVTVPTLSTGYLKYNGSSYIWDAGTGGGMVYPAVGVAVSTGSAWDTSLAVSSLATLTGTQTLTNKRITARVYSEASNTAPAPNADSYDQHNVTALASGATFAAPTGTPTDGQKLIIRVKDNGGAQTLSWNAGTGGYRASTDIALPTTTTILLTLYCGFIYNGADSKWDLVAVTNGF